MSGKFLIPILLIILSSCKYEPYEIGYEDYLPDSNKAKVVSFVENMVKNSNYHMTGGDYEDPEDVISQAEASATRIYSVRTEGLNFRRCHDCYREFIPRPRFTPTEEKIYQELLTRKK